MTILIIIAAIVVMARKCSESEVRFLIIDYLQLISKSNIPDDTKACDYILSKLKDLAQELNIPIVVLCQMNRNMHPKPKNLPQMEDIREVTLWKSVDNVLQLHRPKYFENPDDQNKFNFGRMPQFTFLVQTESICKRCHLYSFSLMKET